MKKIWFYIVILIFAGNLMSCKPREAAGGDIIGKWMLLSIEQEGWDNDMINTYSFFEFTADGHYSISQYGNLQQSGTWTQKDKIVTTTSSQGLNREWIIEFLGGYMLHLSTNTIESGKCIYKFEKTD